MSKAGRSKRKRATVRRRRSEAQRRSRQSRRAKVRGAIKAAWRGVSTAWKITIGVLLVLAALSEIYFSTWRISVTPGQTLKGSDPFATMFILQNEGQFVLHNVKFICALNDVSYASGTSFRHSMAEAGAFNVPQLEGNAQTTVACYLPVELHSSAMAADVTLFVSYRPSFYPFRKNKNFRFIARPKDDGTYLWTPMAH